MPTNKKDETIARLVESNTALAQAAIQLAAQQAATMAAWLEMWRPPAGKVNDAKSMDERLLKQEEDEATAWEPIREDIFAQLDRDLDIPKEFLT